MYIKRKIESTILNYLKRPEYIAVVGPRQCGKTTLLTQLFGGRSDTTFLTFEDPDVRQLFEEDIKGFASVYFSGKKTIIIDEFQYAEKGGQKLKFLYDTYPKTKVIISGSSVIDLTIKTLKFMVGRILILELFPFDFGEYLTFRDPEYARWYEEHRYTFPFSKPGILEAQTSALARYFEEHALFGGYPQVVITENHEEKKLVLRQLYQTYLLRDVGSIIGLVDEVTLSKLAKALALQVGSVVVMNELARTVGVSIATIHRYVSILSKTYIADFAAPFFNNKRLEIVKQRKVFFYDTGLRNSVVDDFRLLSERPDAGSVFENAVWMQLIKRGFKPQYWRDKQGSERDFILELGAGKQVALEAKIQAEKYTSSAAFEAQHQGVAEYGLFLRGKEKEKVRFVGLL